MYGQMCLGIEVNDDDPGRVPGGIVITTNPLADVFLSVLPVDIAGDGAHALDKLTHHRLVNDSFNGRIDDKIIAVSVKDPYYRDVRSLIDVPRSLMEELKHFYSTYKIQEGGHTEVRKFRELKDAYETINRCIENFRKANVTREEQGS